MRTSHIPASQSYCPRLIEVALPIREISAESVRQKSPQRGHISMLHLWWARRPLAAARAVVFASVVPDPDDPRCPAGFREAVEQHLKTRVPTELTHYFRGRQVVRDPDPYRPCDGIADTLRNRLLAFIAKWSPEQLEFETGKSGKSPKPANLLDDRSLVKWETTDPQNPQGLAILRLARELVRAAHDGAAPTVLDPFSGGGAIPLEAARLGCQAIANDYNPVAYLILRATCELPQKYGRPGKRRIVAESLGQKIEQEIDVPNVLVHDVERWAGEILAHARQKIGHFYPSGKDARPVVGYLWARTAPCANPSCKEEMPLLSTLLVCNKDGKRIALEMNVDRANKTVAFGIVRGKAIRHTEGTMLSRGNVRCIYCEQPTPVAKVREAGLAGNLGARMVGVILDTQDGKNYRPVEESDLAAFREATALEVERPGEFILPELAGANAIDAVPHPNIRVHPYGFKTWGSLYSSRQLLAMQTFVGSFHDVLPSVKSEISDEGYRQAVEVYLALWVSRNAMRMTTVGRWDVGEEKFQTPFEGSRLPMKWDYPEANPFAGVTGGFGNQLDLLLTVLRRESTSEQLPAVVSQGDSAALSLADNSSNVVVTDPPYFDAFAYADLSDFFYIWLKRLLGDRLPDVFSMPQAPKSEEATALKHRHQGDAAAADRHFTHKLTQIFSEARRICKPDSCFSVVFAHQSTEAWTALINSLFAAGLTIDATWPIEMEMKNRVRGLNSAALETSITVVCRPRVVSAAASFKEIRKEIEQVVSDSVHRFWDYGFRGADLIVACYGPAVGVFGRHERVEKADGTPVGISELLDLSRRAARDAIAGEFHADGTSTLYFIWATLYGAAEQSWDDARLVVQIGSDESAMDLARNHGIFVVDGSACRLALLSDRIASRGLGTDANPPLIDTLHRSMFLWKQEKRSELVQYLSSRDLLDDGPFWKLAQALFEVLPRDSEDWKLVSAILTERETLRTEAKRTTTPAQPTLPGV